MNESKKNFTKITLSGLIENTKTSIMNKFGFIPSHKRVHSEDKSHDNNFVLSKPSNSKNKNQQDIFKFKLIRNKEKDNNNYNKMSQSCFSLLNNILMLNNNNKNSRNCNNNITSYFTNDNTYSKYYSSVFNSKAKKIFKSSYNNNNSKCNLTINELRKSPKEFKCINATQEKKSQKKENSTLNIKPVIKKKENLVKKNNKLWSKIISSIDQGQSSKMNKLKKKNITF